MIIRAYMGPFIITSFIVLFIFLMQFVWNYLDDLMGKGLEFIVLAKLLLYATASFVPPALPVGVLLASIMTIGNLGENTELTPMRSAGLSLINIMRPLLVLILFISMGSFFFSNNLMPIANLKFKSLLWDVVNKKPTMNLQNGVFYNGIDGFSIRAMSKDPKENTLHDILIYDHRDAIKGNRTVVHAKSGTMQKSVDGSQLVLTLYNGRTYDERAPTLADAKGTEWPLVYSTFEKDIVRFDLATFGLDNTNEDLFKQHFQMLTLGQLDHSIDSLDRKLDRRWDQRRSYLRNSLYITRDTVAVLDQGPFVPMDKFMKKLTPGHRENVYDVALNMVRNSQSFIDRTQDEILGREHYINMHKKEWHRKITLALACIIMFFIGAPMGAIIKRGGFGLPVVIALSFFVVFHLLSFSGEKLVNADEWEAWEGMWMATAVLTPISIFLTYKAAIDSPLFNKEAYYRILAKFRPKKRNEDLTTLQ